MIYILLLVFWLKTPHSVGYLNETVAITAGSMSDCQSAKPLLLEEYYKDKSLMNRYSALGIKLDHINASCIEVKDQ